VSIQTEQASRSIRRHLPKAYSAEPVIKIIQLRRRSPATTSGTAEQRDYSYRWLVRGHWRNQFYPSSKGTIEVVKILTFCRGPLTAKPFIIHHKKSCLRPIKRRFLST
jgi:hypothetical protein